MKKYWWCASALLIVDRLTKLWAQSVLSTQGMRAAWPGVFRFAYARNTGAAFSILKDSNLFLILTTAIMIALVLFVYFRGKDLSRLARVGLLLVAAGGLGNLIDRFQYGYVVDFIDLEFMRFAVFNVADILVCVGAALSAVGLLMKGARRDAMDG